MAARLKEGAEQMIFITPSSESTLCRPRPNSRVISRHLAGIPTKRAIRRLEDALVATLLTFCPLSRTSIRWSSPMDAVLRCRYF